MKPHHTILLILALAATLCGCNRLTKQAKEIVGIYYLTTLSETEPVMELNSNGRCLIHAIKPGVMSYTVEGKWNVVNDSLTITTNGKVKAINGDTATVQIGQTKAHTAMHIVDFNGTRLTLNRDGNDYVYTRRGQN